MAISLASFTTFAQEVRVDIGLLICGHDESAEVASGRDAVAADTQMILCVFRPSNSGPEEVYTGTFQTIGEEQEVSRKHAMIWIVKASAATQRSTGILQQLYAADRSVPSTHPPPLIGETNSSIVLQTLADTQPLSSANKQSKAIGVIVLVALKLLSSPA